MVQRAFNNVLSCWVSLSSGSRANYKGEALFSRLVYLWILINGLFLLPIMDLVIGVDGYTYRTPFSPTLRDNLVYMLNYSPERYVLVYCCMMAASFMALINLGGMLVRFLSWGSLLIIASSTNLLFNAGIHVTFNWAFLLIFLFPMRMTGWKVLLSRLAFLGVKVQFLIIYFFSGVFKLNSEDWYGGDAVRLLSFLPQYTPDWTASILQSINWLAITLNYLIMFYLILFPLLIWVRKIKTPLMIIGLGFHLYIALVMGLYDFGAIMLIGYLLFLSEKQTEWLLGKIAKLPIVRVLSFKIKT
jgi:hypothetical protein